MYDYLNNISRNIEQNHVDIKKSQEHQKQVEYIQNELDGALFGTLQDYVKRYNYNIFDDEIKSIAIDEVLNSENLTLYNKNYTIQYLNKKYYTIARQVEQINKKQNSTKDDYKKQIAMEKWQLQKQAMQEKAEAEKQKAKAYRQHLSAIQWQNIFIILVNIATKAMIWSIKLMLYMLLAPIFIIAAFTGGFVGGMIKLK